MRVHIDNETVVKGVARGKRWCCQARRPHADVWRRIWHILDDVGVGPAGVEVLKCRSHTSAATRRGMTESEQFVAAGNDVADQYAKQGAEADPFEACRATAEKDACRQVCEALKFVGIFAEHAKVDGKWPDVTPWPPRAAHRADADGRRGRRWKAPPQRPHEKEVTAPGRWRCAVCWRTASTRGARRAFAWAECAGSLADEWSSPAAQARQAKPGGHALMLTGPYVWCLRCVVHSKKRVVGLARRCAGAPASGQYAMLRRRLGSGKDPYTGERCGDGPRRLSCAAWASKRAASAGGTSAGALPPAKRHRRTEAEAEGGSDHDSRMAGESEAGGDASPGARSGGGRR